MKIDAYGHKLIIFYYYTIEMVHATLDKGSGRHKEGIEVHPLKGI